MTENAVYIDHEFDIPETGPSPGSVHIMIKHHERQVHRFMDWLKGQGLVVCRGAMPQSDEKIKDLYHQDQYNRRGLCAPSAS